MTTVAPFELETFEVTVGRFRRFVDAYPGSMPAPGAGAHPLIAGSGWDVSWAAELPPDRATLAQRLACASPDRSMWTDTVGANENKPINCVSWYELFAFCAWDGGRLPTEAEWELAAVAGAEARSYPWGEAQPAATLAVFGNDLPGGHASIATVGSVPLGNGKWGQRDLAGNVLEWSLDWKHAFTAEPCDHCASIGMGVYRVLRGGSFSSSYCLPGWRRCEGLPSDRSYDVGGRCARTP